MRIHENGQVEIDGIDKLILNAFMDNANMPVSQLAKELGISNFSLFIILIILFPLDK